MRAYSRNRNDAMEEVMLNVVIGSIGLALSIGGLTSLAFDWLKRNMNREES